MAAKMKGIYKGFKYISHLFDGKERELQIGYPTDVKHVAHIGLDDPDGSTPSWMNEFNAGADFSLSSVGSMGGSKGGSMGGSKGGSIGGSCRDPTSTSQDFEASLGSAQTSNIFSSFPPTNLANAPKKQKRNKGKSPRNSNSSPKSGSARSSAVSRKSPLGQKAANGSDEAHRRGA